MNASVCGVAPLLDQVVFGQPKFHRNLLFVPILLGTGDAEEHPGRYVPLTAALRARQATVQESVSVDTLLVENTRDEPLFAPAGSYFRGGGQDRVLTVSIVVAAHARGYVPVRRVERGRWNAPLGAPFSIPEAGSLVASAVLVGSSNLSQQETWDTVHDLAQSTKTITTTGRHGDSYTGTTDALQGFRSALTLDGVLSRPVGAVFLVRYLPETRVQLGTRHLMRRGVS